MIHKYRMSSSWIYVSWRTMDNKAKKSIINFGTSLLYKIITIGIGLLLPRLFITSYGSEVNGLQSSVNQIFTYISLIEGGIGAATLQSLYSPVSKKDTNKINAYLSATSEYYNVISIIYFVILFIAGLTYSTFIQISGYSKIFVLSYVMVSGAVSGINFFYLAKLKLLISANGDEYIVTVLTMCTFITTSTIKIVLIYYGVNIILLQLGYLIINIIITFVYYLISKKKYPWLSFKEKPDKSCVAQKNSVLIHRISSVIFQNIDIMLLTFMCNLGVVSIYALYKMVVSTITTIVATMGDSVNFVFGQTYNSDTDFKKKKYCKLIDVFNVYYSAIAFGLFSIMFVLIIPFMKLYTAGMDQSYIYEALPFLYISIELLAVGRESMMRTIEVAGHFKKTQWRAVIESIINLTVSILAIMIFKNLYGNVGGLYGALIGTIAAMLYRTIDINIYANKVILTRKSWKSFWVMIVNTVTLVLMMLIIKPLIHDIENYLDFFITGLWLTPLTLFVSVGLQSLVNINEFRIVINYVKGKINGYKMARSI